MITKADKIYQGSDEITRVFKPGQLYYSKERYEVEDFISNLQTDGTYTFDADVIRESSKSFPLTVFPSTGITLFPFAYKGGSIALMNNSDGSIVDAAFNRSGNGWAMQNGNIVQLGSNLPRWDDIFYEKKGYLLEESTTNSQAQNTLIQTSSILVNIGLIRTFSIDGSLNSMANIETDGSSQNYGSASFVGATGATTNTCSLFLRINSLSANLSLRVGVTSSMMPIDFVEIKYNGVVPYISNTTGAVQPPILIEIGNGIYFLFFKIIERGAGNRPLTIGIFGGSFEDNFGSIDVMYPNRINADTSAQSVIITGSSSVTRPAESLQIPITATTDIWLKTDQGEQLIEAVPSGSFNVHDYITNGKLISLLAPMRAFTEKERIEIGL